MSTARRWLWGSLGWLGLQCVVGCGGGHGEAYIPAAVEQARRAPVVGNYSGAPNGLAENAVLTFRVAADGVVAGRVTFRSRAEIALTGIVEPDRTLVLSGDGLRVSGEFRGARHPSDPRRFIAAGVHYLGTWMTTDGRTGTADAWHEDWPPAIHIGGGSGADSFWGDFVGSVVGALLNGSDEPPAATSGTGGSSSGGTSTTPTDGYVPPESTETGGGGGDPVSDIVVYRQAAGDKP